MQASLFANLTSLTLSSSLNGGALTWPRLVAGADLTLTLRWAQNLEGRNTEVPRTLTALKASLGKADARPTSGSFKLHLGSDSPEPGVNLTDAIPFDASALLLQNAINALSVFDCAVTEEAGTFRIRLNEGTSEVEAAVLQNTLRPVAFVEWAAVTQNGEFIHELRLTQTPVAQIVDWALVAAQPPALERLQSGGSNDDVAWNEVQKLTIPPDFRGSFQLRRGYRKSPPIGLPTSAEAIAEALEPLADIDSAFITTEVQDGVLIEFSGDMGGLSHDLLTVEVIDQAPGDPTFTLRTDTAECWSLLAQLDPRGELRLPLEIKVWLEDTEGDEPDQIIIFKQEVVITAPVDVAARNIASEINWNQPRGRRAVLPFAPDQVLLGHRSYQAVIGDGTSTSFTLNHNLNADGIQVVVRENLPGGRLITAPLEYNAAFDDPNALTLTPQTATLVGGVLAPSAWIVHLTTVTHPASYAAHGHLIGEIDGLRPELDALGAAVSGLQALVPTGALSVRETPPDTPVFEARLAGFTEAFPSRQSLSLKDKQSLVDLDPASLPRDGGLLPACHDDSITNWANDYLPDPVLVGQVYQFTGTSPLRLPGLRGRRSVLLLPNQFFANNGEGWYRVTREEGTESSFYPTDFDRELFLVAVNSRQLIAKRVAELRFGFETALMSRRLSHIGQWTWDTTRNARAQWELVIEWGSFAATSTPGTPGSNLSAILWHATPILRHRLVLTRTPAIHIFGCRIKRAANGSLSSDALYYGASEAGGSIPASADFALRARLCRFDIDDQADEPRGLVLFDGLSRSSFEDPSIGKLIIR